MGYKKAFAYLVLGVSMFFLLASSVLAESSTSGAGSFGGVGVILAIIMIYQVARSERKAFEESKKRIGVAGWLLFFTGLIALSGSVAVLRVILDMVQMIVFGPSVFFFYYSIYSEILDLVVGIALMIAAYHLWKVKPGARWLAIGVMAFDIVSGMILGFVTKDYMRITLASLTMVWWLVMILYFTLSVRVKNTYSEHAKIPKQHASSNRTVHAWLVYQAIVAILVLVVFQFTSWTETANYKKDVQCIDFCSQYDYNQYYFHYEEDAGGFYCECQKSGEYVASTVFPELLNF
jgi:hypothetical protein